MTNWKGITLMFELEQIVMHPTAGVCKIESIEKKIFSRTDSREYFVLKNIFGNNTTTIYLPVDSNKVGVRYLFKSSQITEFINAVDFNNSLWIENDNARQEVFHNILKSGDITKTVQMIIEIHRVENEKQNDGKKLRVSDSKILKEAEKAIYEEFAFVLNLKLNEVPNYISKTLDIENFIFEE